MVALCKEEMSRQQNPALQRVIDAFYFAHTFPEQGTSLNDFCKPRSLCLWPSMNQNNLCHPSQGRFSKISLHYLLSLHTSPMRILTGLDFRNLLYLGLHNTSISLLAQWPEVIKKVCRKRGLCTYSEVVLWAHSTPHCQSSPIANTKHESVAAIIQ